MYTCTLFIEDCDLCEVRLKSITQVCKFLDTVNFEICGVWILSPKGKHIPTGELLSIWHS